MNRLAISFLAFIIFIFMNCASTQKSIEPAKTISDNTSGQSSMKEDFDPMSLDDYNIVVKPKPSESDILAAPIVSSSLPADTSDSNAPEMVDGFRVQIISTTDEITAREIRKHAILKQDMDVYLIFDSPYYKVRVGNCLTRSEADELQELLVKKGFLNAWVIRTRVFLNKTAVPSQNE